MGKLTSFDPLLTKYGGSEEAVISSMFHAEPVTGRAGNFRDSLANWVRLDDFAPEAQR